MSRSDIFFLKIDVSDLHQIKGLNGKLLWNIVVISKSCYYLKIEAELAKLYQLRTEIQWGLEANEGPELKRARGHEVLKDMKNKAEEDVTGT